MGAVRKGQKFPHQKVRKRQKLSVGDMREIANFHRMCLNYIKMKRIEERAKNEEKV